MTVLNKQETVNVRNIEEAMEYIQTAMKQGYQRINITKDVMNSYIIEITDTKARVK